MTKIVKDPALIDTLMKARNLTARDVAAHMGWKAHSYVNRLRNGSVKTLSDEAATDLARLLKVAPSLLFVSKPSADSRRNVHGSAA